MPDLCENTKSSCTLDKIKNFIILDDQKNHYAFDTRELYEEEKKDVDISSFFTPFGLEEYSGIKVKLKPTERYQDMGLALIRYLKGPRIEEMPDVVGIVPDFEGLKVKDLIRGFPKGNGRRIVSCHFAG